MSPVYQLEMTPLCKVDVTQPGVRWASGVRDAVGVDEQEGIRPARAEKCTLLAFVDDATSRLMHLRFVASESTFDYFRATRT
jgi:hypothetical protein